MISRVLIANRGEIALRVIRACMEAGISTVAVYSKADSHQSYLSLADDAVCISESSYLDIPAILTVARNAKCDAVHPGYGLLSENAGFVRETVNAGFTFIGPSAELIDLMGNKAQARGTAAELGLQTIPGTNEAVESLGHGRKLAQEFGFPVLLKAAFGGGGRGMRLVTKESEFESLFSQAQAEASAGFGNGAMYIEKWLPKARHVEVQIVGDGKGKVIHLGTRDCSIQRQNQKLIEEAPAPFIDQRLLRQIENQCVAAAARLKYRSAGTFEFLFVDDEFYFIEMNTRLQVEHAVTEVVTGVDIVGLQLEIAASGELPIEQDSIHMNGHAIELRVNAEGFDVKSGRVTPSPGTVSELSFPGGPGIRIDSHLAVNQNIPHQYDSLIAKLVCSGNSRDEAIRRCVRCVQEMRVKGVTTNLPLLAQVVESEGFRNGKLTTSFLNDNRDLK